MNRTNCEVSKSINKIEMSVSEVKIGVEIHIELKTKSKLFSSSPNKKDNSPNNYVSAIDLGIIGCLPLSPNKKAVELAIVASKLLSSPISSQLTFDRKHYFYPDLAKGYQITQFFNPIGKKGFLDIYTNNGKKLRIPIKCVQLEEDTAKQIHLKNQICLDYNRSGSPLIEIVSSPIFSKVDDVIYFLKLIKNLVIYYDISSGKMEDGSFRFDINISTSKFNNSTRTEIKNLNSFKNARRAIKMEINEQQDSINPMTSITKRYDEKLKKNVKMRTKVTGLDYSYISEPNIPPFILNTSWVNKVINKYTLQKDSPLKRLQKLYRKKAKLQPQFLFHLAFHDNLYQLFTNIKNEWWQKKSNFISDLIIMIINKSEKDINGWIEKQKKWLNQQSIKNFLKIAILSHSSLPSSLLKDFFLSKKMPILPEKKNITNQSNTDKLYIDKSVDRIINEFIHFIKNNRHKQKKIKGFIMGKIALEFKDSHTFNNDLKLASKLLENKLKKFLSPL